MIKVLPKNLTLIVVCLVALTGCSKNMESAYSNTSNTQQHQSSGATEDETDNEEPVIAGSPDEEGNGLGEGIGNLGVNEGSEAVQAYIPEGFPVPSDHQMIENETVHIYNETTDIVNITYLTETSTKDMYSQYADYFEKRTEYTVTSLSDPMLLTAISDQDTFYIEITEVDNSTKVYISISIPKE